MQQRTPPNRQRAARLPKKAYRHELKYFLEYGDYLVLRSRLSQALRHDEHAEANGGEYHIRSLYFDDMVDGAFREKLAGVDSRDKFRIRIYNHSDSVIKLERKHKRAGYIQKHDLPLTRDECEMLMDGEYAFLAGRKEPFAKYMLGEFASKGLKPVVLVDYVREPFVFALQDVRITFDKDIRTGYRSIELFDPYLPTYPVVEGYDMVMEVKFNEYLPSYIRELLQVNASTRSAISKYVLCRKFEI